MVLLLVVLCLRRCVSFQLTRHVTLPRVPHTNIKYLDIEIWIFCCCQMSQYLEGYLVLNVGKLGSYISFLVKPPPALSFIVSIAEAGAYIRWLYRHESLQQFKQNTKNLNKICQCKTVTLGERKDKPAPHLQKRLLMWKHLTNQTLWWRGHLSRPPAHPPSLNLYPHSFQWSLQLDIYVWQWSW